MHDTRGTADAPRECGDDPAITSDKIAAGACSPRMRGWPSAFWKGQPYGRASPALRAQRWCFANAFEDAQI